MNINSYSPNFGSQEPEHKNLIHLILEVENQNIKLLFLLILEVGNLNTNPHAPNPRSQELELKTLIIP